MREFKKRVSITFLAFIISILYIQMTDHFCFAQQPDQIQFETTTALVEFINQIPDIKTEEIKFELLFPQPLDHNNLDGQTFYQRVHIRHVDPQKPTVLITEGYSFRFYNMYELADILGGNEIRIEHRYFGESVPDTLDWRYLNIEQATADYHKIVETFKNIYKGKWIATGWSKGGQTSLAYYRHYPNDMDAIVAYVAPLNFSTEDPRIDQFFKTVGTKYCRDKIRDFQQIILKRKGEVLPLFKSMTDEEGYTYSIGHEKAFEFCVLEYPFSFWQYEKIECETIPGEAATPKELLDHLNRVVSFYSYSDARMNSASMYQFATEWGYYGYVRDQVQNLLSDMDYDNTDYAPQNVDITFKPEVMQDLNNWLQNQGNNIIYIYGERDPWSGTAVEVSDQVNSLKMVLKGGNHFTYIKTFPKDEQDKILSTLEDWLGVKIKRSE